MAQKAALKTNLLSDGFLNPNAAVEIGPPRNGLSTCPGNSISGNSRTTDSGGTGRAAGGQILVLRPFLRTLHRCARARRAIQHRRVRPRVLHALQTDFSKLKDTRYQGWFVAAEWPTATTGTSRSTGTRRRKSVSDESTRASTGSAAPDAERKSRRTSPTTISSLQKIAINLVYIF